MSRFHKLFNNFAGGEFSPTALGRVDSKEYMTASQLMSNWIPRKNYSGKRSGTRYMADLSGMFRPGLIPFVVSAEVGFIIAIDPSKVLIGGGDFVRAFRSDGVSVAIDSTPFDSVLTTYSTPSLNLDPNKYIYVQQGDRLIICHASGGMIPFMLTRIADGTFVLELYTAPSTTNPLFDPSIILKTPYRPVNVSSISLQPSAVSGAITITASASFFTPEHVGAFIKINQAGTAGVAQITGYSSDTSVSASVKSFFSNTSASTAWQESAWSDHLGWPRTICSFEQRLIFAGSSSQPDTIWGSTTGNIFTLMARKLEQDQDQVSDVSGNNYFGENLPTDPFSFTLAASEINLINWMVANSSLNIGTASTEYVGNGGQEILSNQSVNFRAQTNYGSSENRAAALGNEVLYISRDSQKLRNFKFSENNGSNISNDLSFFSNHMYKVGDSYAGGGVGGTESGFVDMAFEKSNDIIWFINRNRRLVSFTYQLDNPTVAWARHEISGQVAIWGVASIPSQLGVDTAYITVERVIDGNTEYYLEAITEIFDNDSLSDIQDASVNDAVSTSPIFTDCTKVIIAPLGGIQTLTALNYLEGEEVTVTIDGILDGVYTISGGEIDLGRVIPEDSYIILGLAYRGDLVGVPLQAGGNFGPGIADIKRIDTVQAKFYKTFDCKMGGFGAKFTEDINFGTDLFTGLKQIKLDADPEREHALHIYSDQPYPCNILYTMQRGKADD